MGATGYKIERSTDGSTFKVIASVAATTGSYTDANLTSGTYWYRVRAFNATTVSPYSNVAKYSATTSTSSSTGTSSTSTSSGTGLVSGTSAPTSTSTAVAPKITTQPSSLTAVAGTSVSFQIAASGSPTPAIQWRKNGVNISGATSTTLKLGSVAAATEGNYSAVVKNSAGSVTSGAATLTVVSSTVTAATSLLTDAYTDPGRLGQISARAIPGTGSLALRLTTKIINAPKSIVMRSIGPGLAPYTDAAKLFDPKLAVYSSGVLVTSNDNWGGSWTLRTTFSRLGAFPLSDTSRDAALLKTLSAATYESVTYGDNTGIALAEVYDADVLHPPAGRISKLFAQAKVRTGDGVMVVGFTVIGDTSLRVLLRAIGPSLSGITGTLADPQMTLYKGSTYLQSNDNWGGSSTLASIFTKVGAASLSSSSKDSAIYLTLSPGAYTAVISGVNSTSGVARFEIYEVR